METILAASIPALLTGVATIVTVILTNRKSMRDITLLTLRNNIQQNYYEYRKDKLIPWDVYHGMCEAYDKYVALGGNSYISRMKQEMDGYDKY